MSTEVNRSELESKVQAMYRDVAQNPHGEFHFEMGRALASDYWYGPPACGRLAKVSLGLRALTCAVTPRPAGEQLRRTA